MQPTRSPDERLPPSTVQPASIQLRGCKLGTINRKDRSQENDDESTGVFSPDWLSEVSELLTKPDTSSISVDVHFVIKTSEDQWYALASEMNRSCLVGRAPTEWHFDFRCLDATNFNLVLRRMRSLLNSYVKPNGISAIRKAVVFGLTSLNGELLSLLPVTLMQLQLYFQGEGTFQTADDNLAIDEENQRLCRVEAMLRQYILPLARLNSLTIKYEENDDSYLPISAKTLASLLECPSFLKIEFERCSIREYEDNEDNDDENDYSGTNTVYHALSVNNTLFSMRMRSGEIASDIGESIALALELNNRSMRYIDMGDMGLDGTNVATAMTKAIARNQVLQGAELNLNSIENFHFVSLGNLTCIDLSDNFLGDEGGLQLAQLIPACPLERMNLAENGIGQIGGCAIAWSLMHSNSLSKINLCNNPLFEPEGGGGPRSDVTARIFNAFKDTPAYRQGFLGMLCSSLRHNKSLTFINLDGTGVDDSHGPLLAILFRVSSLDGIGLLRNNIGDSACIYICQALSKYRTTLKVLMIEMNPISERGFYAFWKGVLLTNDTLISIRWGKQTYVINGIQRGQRDIDLALRLNKAGMVRLRRDKNATREQWVEGLITLRDDVDCSFTFLVENPFILKE